MKQNFVESQYIQLAKEQFCQIIKAVPFVSDIEIIPTGLQCGFGDFHAIVHYSDSDQPQHFCVEVKPNGEKRFVNMFMQMATQYHDNSCYVFMAPYVSDTSAETNSLIFVQLNLHKTQSKSVFNTKSEV